MITLIFHVINHIELVIPHSVLHYVFILPKPFIELCLGGEGKYLISAKF